MFCIYFYTNTVANLTNSNYAISVPTSSSGAATSAREVPFLCFDFAINTTAHTICNLWLLFQDPTCFSAIVLGCMACSLESCLPPAFSYVLGTRQDDQLGVLGWSLLEQC